MPRLYLSEFLLKSLIIVSTSCVCNSSFVVVYIVWKDPQAQIRFWLLLKYQPKKRKRNNKVNWAEKGAPADFSIWANVTAANAPVGLI